MKRLFPLLYLLFSVLLFLAALPFILFLLSKPKYRKALPARFFGIGNARVKESALWFHACSYGEVTALKPLFRHLQGYSILLSTITQTGHAQGERSGVKTRFLPFELLVPFWAPKSKVLVVLEAELWYMLFKAARAKGAKTVLLNARISDRSYRRYYTMRFFYRQLFRYVDKVFCQTPTDKARLELLGARDVEVIGNIKLAELPVASRTIEKPQKGLIVAASTHEGEEALILEALRLQENEILAVVPRHPERFDAVGELVAAYAKAEGRTFARFSESGSISADVVLVDVMGELVNLYAISDLVILGGAFLEGIGGHNPIEPAAFGCKIITGRHFFNLKSLMPLVENLVIISKEELGTTLQARAAIKPARIDASVDLEPFYTYIERELHHG